MKQITLILVITLVFLCSLAAQEGKKAPDFTLEDLNGKKVELKSVYAKNITILSFWATWCKPCMEEMKELNKLFNEYSSKGVTLLALSTDNEKTVSKVKSHIKTNGYSFTVLYDTNSEVARKYYVTSVPHTVIVDKKGKIVYSHSGYVKGDEQKLKAQIESLLK